MILKEGGQELIQQWLNSKHDALKSLDIESRIIEFIRLNIDKEIELYAKEELVKASMEVKDMFDMYSELKEKAPALLDEKINLTGKINKLRIRQRKWGLLDEEADELNNLLDELNVIDIQLTIYNHVVNFSMPNTLKLYIECETNFKLLYLLEMYEFIGQDNKYKVV